MSDAVIIATARTPIRRARKGTLAGMDAFQLAEVVLAASLERSGVPVADIDDLIVAESYQGGGVIARNIAVRQGIIGVPGLAQNRHCASGLSAVATAAAGIRAGMDTVVLAGGTESLSTHARSTKKNAEGKYVPWMSEPNPGTPLGGDAAGSVVSCPRLAQRGCCRRGESPGSGDHLSPTCRGRWLSRTSADRSSGEIGQRQARKPHQKVRHGE
jgi:acetyl-CoA acetyltransferase